ncbi:MAG: glycosyl transferase [Candidatus Hodarchaeota archaeon]
MFREFTADIYVMVDGDSTYAAEKVHALIEPITGGNADMTVAARLGEYEQKSFRLFHKFGNELIRRTINLLFGTHFTDILSGYRCFNSRFVKNIPILSKWFEVETELTLQALDKELMIKEIPFPYYKRLEGSFSKLNTYLDGVLILKTILSIFKDYSPLKCFSLAGLLFQLISPRLILFPFLVLILWFGAEPYRKVLKLRIVIVTNVITLIMLGLNIAKYAQLNNYFEEYFSGTQLIEPTKIKQRES